MEVAERRGDMVARIDAVDGVRRGFERDGHRDPGMGRLCKMSNESPDAQ
jgi:hypothetical protein